MTEAATRAASAETPPATGTETSSAAGAETTPATGGETTTATSGETTPATSGDTTTFTGGETTTETSSGSSATVSTPTGTFVLNLTLSPAPGAFFVGAPLPAGDGTLAPTTSGTTAIAAPTTATASTPATGAGDATAVGSTVLATAQQTGVMQTLADFGAITINGVTTYLGAIQGPYTSSSQAAQFVAGALNANPLNTIVASVDADGRLSLASKDGTSGITIDRVGVSTTGDASQLVDLGFQTGTFDSSVTGGVPTSPYFSDAFAA